MSATRDPADDSIPQAVVRPRRRFAIQLVWLVPVLAALIAAVLGVRAWVNAGPTITIQFPSAEGLEPGKTRIRYKSVDIGSVKAVTLSADRKAVVVTAAMSRGAASLLLDDTRFWVVRPRFTGGELTGLSTLLSGAYIGVDAGHAEDERREFIGLAAPPSITTDEPGREVLLHSTDIGSLDLDSPVYFRRINVGKVTAFDLDGDGRGVTLKVFVRSPYERFVTTDTRFWHSGGVDLALDADGVKLQTQSLVTLLLGGIVFGTPPVSPAAPAAAQDARFTLFGSETLAMKRGDGQLLPLRVQFDGSVRGLSVGAPVDFRGIVIGEVRSIDMAFDAQAGHFRLPVELVLYRDMLDTWIARAPRGKAPSAEAALKRAIERGLRAQLRSGNLLTGQRYIALDFVKPAPAPALTLAAASSKRLEIPSVSGGLDDLQDSLTRVSKSIEQVPFGALAQDLRAAVGKLQQVLDKVDRLPLEGLAGDLRGTLATLDATLRRFDKDLAPAFGATLTDAQQTLQTTRQVLANDSATQQELRGSLRELARAAQSLRELTDLLQRRPESLLRGRAPDPAEGKP
jgi:paraquat-inducible protein B